MKIASTIALLLIGLTAWGQNTGIFQSYVILNIDSTGSKYWYGTKNDDLTNRAFQGANFGAVKSLILKGGELKSFKNSGADVRQAYLYYRIYPVGNPLGIFTGINLAFAENIGTNGDQKWATTNTNINLANGVPSGTYTLEVFWQIITSAGSQYDSRNGLNYTATFTVNSATLPVTLASFTAQPTTNRMVNLKWTTASEANNDYFDVERSADAQTFSRIGQVSGQAGASVRQAYQFMDENPAVGVSYYRLRQVDKGSTFSYSPVRAVTMRGHGELLLLGNPVSDAVSLMGVEPGATVELLDLNGQARHRQTTTETAVRVDVRDLPAGTYLLRVAEPIGVQTRRVLVLH